MTDVGYPYRYDGRGRTADADSPAAHIRELIEQLLFTSPGERVMRPDFGTGLMQLVFSPASADLAAATQMLVQSALQQWLGDRIDLRSVTVTAEESTLAVTVSYAIRATGESRTDTFVRGTAP